MATKSNCEQIKTPNSVQGNKPTVYPNSYLSTPKEFYFVGASAPTRIRTKIEPYLHPATGFTLHGTPYAAWSRAITQAYDNSKGYPILFIIPLANISDRIQSTADKPVINSLTVDDVAGFYVGEKAEIRRTATSQEQADISNIVTALLQKFQK